MKTNNKAKRYYDNGNYRIWFYIVESGLQIANDIMSQASLNGLVISWCGL